MTEPQRECLELPGYSPAVKIPHTSPEKQAFRSQYGYADRILCLWHRARSEARVAAPDNPKKRKSSHISFAEAYKYTKSTSFSPSICYVGIRTVKSPVDSSGLSSSRRDGVSIADTAPGGSSRQPCIKTGTPTGMPQSPIKNQSPRVLPLG